MSFYCYDADADQFTFSSEKELRTFVLASIETNKIPNNWENCNIDILYGLSDCSAEDPPTIEELAFECLKSKTLVDLIKNMDILESHQDYNHTENYKKIAIKHQNQLTAF